jgi:hypothetical protein
MAQRLSSVPGFGAHMQPRNPGTQQSARGLRGGTSWLSGACFGLRTRKTQNGYVRC